MLAVFNGENHCWNRRSKGPTAVDHHCEEINSGNLDHKRDYLKKQWRQGPLLCGCA